ncbi:MAG: Hsp20/alpha crystallin family protein [Candidatus Peribacteraceae bacterium]|nr:Hsp20/alpha crystallin family protein [Candidatus Peribacteraceae bacterium]
MAKQQQNQERQRGGPVMPRSPMSRFFDEPLLDPFNIFASSIAPFASQMAVPAVDVSETEKEIVIKADLPGFDTKDVSVEVNNNIVTIHGRMEEERESEDKRWHRRERRSGEFERQITLPDYADGAKAICKMKNGILQVTIPKGMEAVPRRLRIDTE